MIRFLIALLVLAAPAAASASDRVQLTSAVAVERSSTDASGKPRIVLEEPKVVTPGDKLVFTLEYANRGDTPAADFVVTNPIPPAVAFAGGESAGAMVSVDGGKNWGTLASLKVRQADGSVRAAAPSDVTHIRWTLAEPILAGKSGKLSFRGIVK